MMKVLKTCWRGLDFLRRLTLNLVFLLVLGAVIFAFFYEKPVSVPNNAVLLVTLSGQIVEEDDFDGQGTFSLRRCISVCRICKKRAWLRFARSAQQWIA